MLARRSTDNVCVVGDSDQSIYSYQRGADIRNILEFEEAFPDATVIPLEQNYRSTKTILDAANAVIANNVTRVPKELWTEGDAASRYRPLPGRERVRRGGLGGDRDRPALRRTRASRYGDVAVFYRTNAQSRALEEALVRAAIAYKVVGGTRFYDRREIKDLLAYLRVLANPADEVSARRIVNVPRRGVGDTSVERLAAWARDQPMSFATSSAIHRRGRRDRQRRQGCRGAAQAARRSPCLGRTRGAAPAVLLERWPSAPGTGPSSRPRTPSRHAAGSRTSPSWSVAAAAVRQPRRVPRIGGPGRRQRRARRRRTVGCRS